MVAEISAVPATQVVEQDDIEMLRHSLAMPDMPYVDFSAINERTQALARWPLLADAEALR